MNVVQEEQVNALWREIVASMRFRGLKRAILRKLLDLSAKHGIVYASKPRLAEMTGAGERWTRETIVELVRAGVLREISQKAQCLPSILWFPGLIELTEEQARSIFWSVYDGTLRQTNAGGQSDLWQSGRQSNRQSDRQYSAGQEESIPPRGSKGSGGDERDTRALELYKELLPILEITPSPSTDRPTDPSERAKDIRLVGEWLLLLDTFFEGHPHPHMDARRLILAIAREERQKRPTTVVRYVRYLDKPVRRKVAEFEELVTEIAKQHTAAA
jgi:hypothetical protein